MILLAQNISKAFGERQILDQFSLKVQGSDFTILYGASGCGKTTLLSILASLTKPDSGELYLDEKSLIDIKPKELAYIRNRCFGFVFQGSNMLMHLNVYENIALPFHYSTIKDKNFQHELIQKQLDFLNIAHLQNKNIATLSGGEQQRVALARALVLNPQIIFADEPTGNLDEKNSLNIYNFFQKTVELGKSIIMVTHDQNAKKFASKVVTLD